MKFLISCFLVLMIPIYSMGQQNSSIESVYIDNINNEILKSKLKYKEENATLYNDIQDVLVSLKVQSNIPSTKKIKCLNILYKFVNDINTNLYSERKFSNGTYNEYIRNLPTLFYFLDTEDWMDYVLTNYKDAIPLLPFVYSDYSHASDLKKIALEHPSTFYQNIDDMTKIYNFRSIFNDIYEDNPLFWVSKVTKKDFLKKTINQTLANKQIFYLFKNYGDKSVLYGFIDPILKNNFNDSKEPDLKSGNIELTKILLDVVKNKNAVSRGSAIKVLEENTAWILNNHQSLDRDVLKEFDIEDLIILMTVNHDHFSNYEYMAWTNFIRNNYNTSVSDTLVSVLPYTMWKKTLTRNKEANNLENFALLFDLNPAANIVSFDLKNQQISNKKHTNWFSKKEVAFVAEEKVIETAKKAPIVYKNQRFLLPKSKLALLNWTRNINKINSNINNILGSAIGDQFEEFVCKNQPNTLLKNRKHISDRPDFVQLIDKTAYSSPMSVKTYLSNPSDPVSIAVSKSSNPNTMLVKQIYDKYGFNSKAYTLIHKISSKEMSIERADQISKSELNYMKELMDISVSKNPIGIHSVEEAQNELTLKYIRNINDNPRESHPHLGAISGFNTKQLYSLMVLGKEEIFQFAFDHFYSYFKNRLGSESFIDFLPSVNDYRYREFCVLLANFDRFSDLIYRNATDAEVESFIKKFVKIDFNQTNAVEEAADVCEFINNCDDSRIQAMLQEAIYNNFIENEKKNDDLAEAVYSLLGSNVGHRAVVHKEWFTKMENDFAQYTLSYINVDDLKNKDNKIIEVCFFYNDADGIASFNSFISAFSQKSYWMLQDLGTYYYISSVYGNQIEIFANKPSYEEQGQRTIKEYLTVNDLEPSIIIHRGHSYHSQKTIDQMLGSPKFIFMGSCGGYYKIPELLLRSPDAQILSTKQVGTMSINDPMIISINELLRNNENIDWPEFWSSQTPKFYSNRHFKMYIPPHKNNAALYINAFFKLVNKKNL